MCICICFIIVEFSENADPSIHNKMVSLLYVFARALLT